VTSRRSLYALVFLAGVGTLATEICASRLLAPYYGSSTIVWANIIGLTLASLSLGYWLGGRIADRNPSGRLLGRLVLGAALLVATIPFVSEPILDVASSGLDEVSAGAVVGSFFGTLLLFAPPIVVLGMVAPFAIRLAIADVASAGQVAGRLYALSTVGSLFGTFLPALVTIPLVGTQRTLLASSALLAAASASVLGRRWLVATVAIAVLLAVPPGVVKPAEERCSTRSSRRTSTSRWSSATACAGST
jgi:predicted membrane-bound spermidine synthase